MKSVISASRRTDIPAFYLPWLLKCLHQGYADIISPRGLHKRVGLLKEEVHTLVLFSKNFGPFLKNREAFTPYHLFFHFTLNDCTLLEPGVSALHERLQQIELLAKVYGPERINWRFDPIVFWDEGRRNNLSNFEMILKHISALKIKRCTFSFATPYASVLRRMHKKGIDLHDPPKELKMEIVSKLAKLAHRHGMTLFTCCQTDWLELDNVSHSSCIDGKLLSSLKGEKTSIAKDRSQRPHCGCTKSIDIGSYTLRCPHGCLYCYANPD